MVRYIICLIVLLLFLPSLSSASRLPAYEPAHYFSGNIILARGDSFEVSMFAEPASMWLFSNTKTSHLYDKAPNIIYPNAYPCNIMNAFDIYCHAYTYEISKEESYSLQPGEYTILLQRNGTNTIKEVSYIERIDSLGKVHGFLVSPYKTVPDVEIGIYSPAGVKEQFLKMISGYSDDEIETLTMDVQIPSVSINEIDQINESAIYIYGKTNRKSGTVVEIIWDSDNVVSPKDIAKNTYYLTASSINPVVMRTFEGNLVVNIQDLAPGRHWVTVRIGDLVSRIQFTRYSSFDRNITIEPIYYLDSGIIVTPTPVTVIQTVIEYKDRIIHDTPTPTPEMTDALGEVYDPFQRVNAAIALVIDLALLAVALCFLLLGGGAKWKK